MKKLAFFFVFFASMSIMISNAKSLPRKKKPLIVPPEEYYDPLFDTLVAEVVFLDNPDSLRRHLGVFYCGNRACYGFLNFRVEKVISGTCPDSLILINILCPLDMIDFDGMHQGKAYIWKLHKYQGHYTEVFMPYKKDTWKETTIKKEFVFYQTVELEF